MENKKLDSYIEAYADKFDYAFDNNIMLNWYPERIMEFNPLGGSLLELGIGHGFTTNRFSKYFKNHVVIDGSAEVIKSFRSKYPECSAKIVQSYFEEFDTKDRYDVIIFGFVLEHLENPGQILKKYKKFLNEGGRCYVTVPNGESLHRRVGFAACILDDVMEMGNGDIALGHKRLYSVTSLSNELNTAGYVVTRKEGIFLKPFTTAQLISLKLNFDIILGMCKVGIDYPELCAALLFEAKIK